MDIKDLFLTPVYLLFIYAVAFMINNRIRNKVIRPYFIPALNVKIIGAIALGLIYQFYYYGGDTYNYFKDSKVIWEAFLDSPFKAISIIFTDRQYDPSIYEYVRRIYFYVDPNSYHVVRLSGFFGLFTFHTYSLIAIFFAITCFSGMWALYKVFYDLYPHLHKKLAYAIFFIPSVFFWGSGLLKDTITLGALGWMFHAFYFGIIKRQYIVTNIVVMFLAILVVQGIKVYILLCFLPAAFFWIFMEYRARIRSGLLRFITLPIVIAISIPISYRAITKITEENTRYQLDNITATTKTTAEWLRTVGTSQGGSVYSLGEFDGTWTNMISKAPVAINVSLYRPYLWEAKNPVMLLSALEATFFLFLTVRILIQIKLSRLFSILTSQPILLFCLIFAITFSFAVGVSSYNFGTLVRYKIPMMPFFLSALYIIQSQAIKKKKKKIFQNSFQNNTLENPLVLKS
ncbi:hypothetical protein [Xanthocytophaga flava]|uniref:hypothetical protein n=1 Tax=Xanthocytophaga flava TaxID=3048013 RepID=UPI0028D38A98|nr:hypothetical protein [Xanthocytophaga flavus]MDJ1472135.1 hypothetical protein [Xanthocytophaga flavus]